nr:uncharacterized protein LOC109152077 [Ipomoea batatas]
MLSKRESSESRSLPPDVQEALECNTKKSKHEGGEAMANANPVEDTPRSPLTPAIPQTNIDIMTNDSYKQSLRKSMNYKADDIAEEIVSEYDTLDKQEGAMRAQCFHAEVSKKGPDRFWIQSMTPQGKNIKTPINTVSRGRGGRSGTQRKAAAQKEHIVVKGSTKSKLISKTTVAQQPKELEILSPTTRKPPLPSVPLDDGMEFFNCDTPKDALKNTDRDRNQASLIEDTNMLN